VLATNHNHELLLSQDLGSTWKSIANKVFDFAWARSAGDKWAKDAIVATILEDEAQEPAESQFSKFISL
jgi:hypothetical protein